MSPSTESASQEPVGHGGLLDRELTALGLKPEQVLDVSVNVNPYGPSKAMIDAICAAPIHRYPDPTSTEARRILADSLGAEMNDLVLGNGAADLLWTLVRAFLDPMSTAVIVEPTFSEFRGAVLAVGARAVEWRAPEATDFAIRLEEIARVVVRERAKLVYLCTPGNPTGVPIPIDDVASFARELPGTLVVLDQAFLSMSARFRDAERRMPSNVVCVRSITKDHAIPGVRVGYLLASRPVAARVEVSRPTWTTSAFAQAAVITATRECGFISETRTRWLEDRARLVRRAPVPCIESSAPYVLARVGDASSLRRCLLERHRVLVRDCTSFGLPHHVRLCARPLADEDRLLAALKEELPRC